MTRKEADGATADQPDPDDTVATAAAGGDHRSGRPFSPGAVVLLFAWPAAWYLVLIYVLIQQAIPAGGFAPTWLFLLTIALGSGTEGLVGVALLHRERPADAGPLWLRNRIRWQWPKTWRHWLAAVGVLAGGMLLAELAAPAVAALARTAIAGPPAWWPPFSNPLIPSDTPTTAFPDVTITGNLGFLLGFAAVSLINVAGEEIYYRGYLLPRMRGAFGRGDWVINAVGFAAKHLYQPWTMPAVLVGGLAFSFAAGPLRSLPAAMALHWIGNYLLISVALSLAMTGIG
jgi:membrane protease YdiL (CAAX protease family)